MCRNRNLSLNKNSFQLSTQSCAENQQQQQQQSRRSKTISSLNYSSPLESTASTFSRIEKSTDCVHCVGWHGCTRSRASIPTRQPTTRWSVVVLVQMTEMKRIVNTEFHSERNNTHNSGKGTLTLTHTHPNTPTTQPHS